MTPPEFIRSIYGAMLDNGIAMEDIDRMEFGLYMQILRERAERRARREERRSEGPAGGDKKKTVLLRRGTIDEVW